MSAQRKGIVFLSVVFPDPAAEARALLLMESIREFAGSLCQEEIWCFYPRIEKQLSPMFEERMHDLKVELLPFDIDSDLLRFFFGGQLKTLALAESKARDQFEILAWLDANTLVLQEPANFVLPGNKQLGYRPVHHTLIGSRFDEPLDPFWTRIYLSCNVSQDRVFSMKTHVDGVTVRPYFNAGFLVTRPENGIFQAWYDLFTDVYQSPEFERFYNQDKRYRIFIHQAVLAGVILSRMPAEDIQELPRDYNYPLNLYQEDITDNRPSRLEELKTCRYESFDEDLKSLKIQTGETLRQWINSHCHFGD